MIKIYPAIFEKDPVGYGVYFPDVEGAVTQGADLKKAMENAADALGIMLAHEIEHERAIPQPSEVKQVDDLTSEQFVTLISVDLDDYLKEGKLDKKTIKVPHWLNVRATKAGINFSKTMTEALEKKLGV